MLYLDNSATTQIHPKVKEAMLPYLLEEYGNPSSKFYSIANNAKEAIENARESIATLLNCEADEVVFTSGATESNNMIIKGVAEAYKHKSKHIITSKAEHPSVLEVCRYLEELDYEVTYLNVDKHGKVDILELEEILQTKKTLLVSLIYANNELGSINDIEKIGRLCKNHNVFFHTDATQAIGKIYCNLSNLNGLNFLSFSGHKIFGPKGVGVAIIRKDSEGIPLHITPLIHGGNQEKGYRSGTYAVHNIVGLGEAARIIYNTIDNNINNLKELESKLESILIDKFGDKVVFNHPSDKQKKTPGILSVQFREINNEILLKKLSPYIAASTGSSCSTSKPSHVLEAIGLTLDEVRSTVRFSMSPFLTLEELDIFKEL